MTVDMDMVTEAAEVLAYNKCKLEFNRGVKVWERNPYPAGSPEYLGWKTAVSVLADEVRMKA